MCVSLFSRSFLTIIESILGKIQIITPHGSSENFFNLFKKKRFLINTYAHVKNMYTIRTNKQNIVNDRQQ
jgi:hypothetical protein